MIYTDEELKQIISKGEKISIDNVSQTFPSIEKVIQLEQYLQKRQITNPFHHLNVVSVRPVYRENEI